jgi:acetolactate synthase-1/2/3 large subunit
MDTMVTGRPGPVNLDIPYNVFQEEADVEVPARSHIDRPHRPGASDYDINEALKLLEQARQPVLFIGHGATLAEAGPEITEFVNKYGIPVITSPNGMGCIPGDDPLALGFIGRNGAFPANQAGRFADLVLTIGTRFDDRSASSWQPGYSWNFPSTRLIHIDIDPQELGRNYPPTLGIIADAKTFMRQLLQGLDRAEVAIDPAQFGPWRSEVESWQAQWETFVRPHFSDSTSHRYKNRIGIWLKRQGNCTCSNKVAHSNTIASRKNDRWLVHVRTLLQMRCIGQKWRADSTRSSQRFEMPPFVFIDSTEPKCGSIGF